MPGLSVRRCQSHEQTRAPQSGMKALRSHHGVHAPSTVSRGRGHTKITGRRVFPSCVGATMTLGSSWMRQRSVKNETDTAFWLFCCVMTSRGDGQEKAQGRGGGTSGRVLFCLEELVKSWFLERVSMLLSFTFEAQRALSGTLTAQLVFLWWPQWSGMIYHLSLWEAHTQSPAWCLLGWECGLQPRGGLNGGVGQP